MDLLFFITEIIGTIAFASSGALTAVHKNMDLLGVNCLAVVTAVGGGIIRDLIIGNIPPLAFCSPIYVAVSMVTANIIFIFLFIFKKVIIGSDTFASLYDFIMQVSDAIGLAAFTVGGMNVAVGCGYSSRFLIVLLGVITGVGGGVMRDMLANSKPYIFVRHFYACASGIGALVFVFIKDYTGYPFAYYMCFALVLVLRLLAMNYQWNLPKISR